MRGKDKSIDRFVRGSLDRRLDRLLLADLGRSSATTIGHRLPD